MILRQLLMALGLCALAALTSVQVRAQQDAPATIAHEADPTDVASIDAIMAATYDVISGPAGARDWDRMRSLFAPGARLMVVAPRAPGGLVQFSVDDYITRNSPFFAENGFFERELSRKIDRFGGLAHVFSTYASFHNADDTEPFARGINSFQLLYDGTRWWVTTIYWQSERPDLPIPDEYLPAKD